MGDEVAVGLAEHPQREAVAQREQDLGDRLGLGVQIAALPPAARTSSIPATCSRVRRISAAYSAAMSSLRRERVNSSKTR